MTSLEVTLAVLGAIFGSAGLFTFLQFLINRRDKRRSQGDRLEKKLDTLELSSSRMQLLVLMKLYPENAREILLVAEHYFKDLNGDWYVSSMFNTWLKNVGLDAPIWFKNHENV